MVTTVSSIVSDTNVPIGPSWERNSSRDGASDVTTAEEAPPLVDCCRL